MSFPIHPVDGLGVLLCGHGSRNRLAVEEFGRLAAGVRQRMPELPVAHGYLEFARPVLRDGLDELRQQGVRRVLAVPGLLFAAGHAKNDIPSVLNAYAAETGLRIDYGRELGLDRRMIQAAGARLQEALDAAPPHPLADTLLVVAHDAVNRVLLCRVLGIPLSKLWTFRQAPTTLNLLEGAGVDALDVVRLNDCSHHTALFGEAVHRAL